MPTLHTHLKAVGPVWTQKINDALQGPNLTDQSLQAQDSAFEQAVSRSDCFGQRTTGGFFCRFKKLGG